MKLRVHHQIHAFTLIELVTSLAIFAFAIVSLLGLFPMAFASVREAHHLTYTKNISQWILNEIKAYPSNDVLLGSSDAESPAAVSMDLSALTNPTSFHLAFDENGDWLGAISATQFEAGSSTANYLVRIKVDPTVYSMDPDFAMDLAKIELAITYPAAASIENRTSQRNHTLIEL